MIRTVKELCRVCYTCVRECPAKAIRIFDGQAEIIRDRCIGCGNCVRVCSQGAKQVVSSIPMVEMMLGADVPVAACFAPSFPAEFGDTDYSKVVGMARALGFRWVNEVSFGADLVADAYRELVKENGDTRHIATTCPAATFLVEKYYPELVENLSPVVSPMIAAARMLRELHGNGIHIVFIGPCIAKKTEAVDPFLHGEVDAVLTFGEFREMLSVRRITADSIAGSDFDPPYGGAGSLFPISRGLLQAADIPEDLMSGQVVAADGKSGFVSALKEFAAGDLESKLLEVLACHGCISGAGVTSEESLFSKRTRVSRYVRHRMGTIDHEQWASDLATFREKLDLLREFAAADQRIPDPTKDELREILGRMGKQRPEDELNCGACGYDTCVEHAIAIHKGLAEHEMCLPHTIERLHNTVSELAVSNDELAQTREALIHTEKLASMGQLAAGIAHEVNNPLGVVLMYAHILLDEAGEQNEDLREDLKLIVDQADRCKKIVSGLLQFARQNKTVRVEMNLPDMMDEALRSARVPESITVVREYQLTNPTAYIDRDQIIQVLVNLITNAVAAMDNVGTLTARTTDRPESVVLEIADTGCGIPRETTKKIFEPFYTTKQIGQGTGLGLSVSYGIVKMQLGRHISKQ